MYQYKKELENNIRVLLSEEGYTVNDIGKIKALRKLLNEVGLEADIEFNEDGIEVVENASKFPSVEMVGNILDNEVEEDNVVYLSELKLTGLALVELPASERVPIVASAILQLNGGINNMDQKTLDELVKDFESTGEISGEMLDIIKADNEMLKIIIEKAFKSSKPTEDTTTEETTTTTETTTESTPTTEDVKVEEETKTEEEDKKEELSLSKYQWENTLNKHAEKQGKIKIACSCVDKTFDDANRMYQSGFKLSRIVNILDKEDRLSYVSNEIPFVEKTINLSAIKKDDVIEAIAKTLK